MTAARNWIRATAIVSAVALVAACSTKEDRLKGERIGVREAIGVPEADFGPASVKQANVAIALPKQVNHAQWTHRNGTPQHRIQHPALNPAVQLAWQADIGAGDGRRRRITADPVAAGGRIFAMDSRGLVTATSTNGERIWSVDVTPRSDRGSDISGGGLAVAGNALFVASGYGELISLDTATGGVRWRQGFEGPVQGTPTVVDGLVYVVSRDNRAFAVDASNGRIKWQLSGTPTQSVMAGGAGPAVTGRSAIFPFGSTEVIAALRLSGLRTWGTVIAGERRGRAYTGFSDITGDPVVVGNTIYVGTQSGRTVALDSSSGERKWTANEGAYSPVWPTGNSVFLVSDANQLVRLDAASGRVIWAVNLPAFKDKKVKRRRALFTNYGPVLAGGLLRVASSDGVLRSFDPQSGALVSSVELPGGASSNPIVVNRVLYVVSSDGQLLAFR